MAEIKSVEEQKRESAEIEALAQKYKRSEKYRQAVAERRKREGKAPMPAPMTGDVYGTPEQIKDRLLKQYEQGKIPADVSAEIVENPEKSGQYAVYFSQTPGSGDSIIRYYRQEEIRESGAMPEGKIQYVYEMGVDYPEQVSDVEAWAKQKGAKIQRKPVSEEEMKKQAGLRKLETMLTPYADKSRRMVTDEPAITLQIITDKPLPEDEAINIRSSTVIREARAETEGRVAAKEIYEKAGILEKPLLHVRTLLGPAGYEYVGAATREYGGPLEKLAIDIAFPDVKTTEELVKSDIASKAARRSLGKTTYQILGVDVDERLVSAIHNPVVDVELMFLGGAGVARVAATKAGAKILGSTAGKIGALALTGGYVVERGVRVQQLRVEGKPTEALGTAVTAAAGLAAATAGFKAEYTHIIKTGAAHTVEVDISGVKGGSVSRKIGKGDIVKSRGKFELVEGKLKGLKGETVSVSGKRTGKIITHIPKQTLKVGKKTIKIPEQTFTSAEKHGTLSDQLKIYWRKTGDWAVQLGRRVKLIGPKKETTLIQEISKTGGKATFTKDVPGGKIRTQRDVTVRKFSGISTGKTARKYDFYLVQKGSKLVLAEKAAIGSKQLAKINWIDVQIQPVKGGGGIMKIGPGVTKVTPGVTTAVRGTTPPTPPSTMQIKAQVPTTANIGARIVPNVNPVPAPPKIKRSPEAVVVTPATGGPLIVRREKSEQKGRTVLATQMALVQIPNIQRPDLKLGTGEIIKPGQISIPVTHPITGREVSQKERTAVLAELEPIIDRVPSQPVVPVEVPPNIPPSAVIPNLPLSLYFKLGKVKFKKQQYKKGVITNPIPEIEKVI